MKLDDTLPFEDSRRLTGANLFFPLPGAVLEASSDACDEDLIAAWRARIERAAARLQWEVPRTVARRHRQGVSLAISAPADQLMLATEINEWALCAALVEHDPVRWGRMEAALRTAALEALDGSPPPAFTAPVIAERAALARFERLASVGAHPRLAPLLAESSRRRLSHVLDEEDLTFGSGAGGQSFPMSDLPEPDVVPWITLSDVPTALVTGSNGKTTTVRLLAACAREHGWSTAYNCTDGVFVDGEVLASGDYSGPAGARMVLRERRAQAAILETARGGILRRGIAVSDATVAVITNVSADHFGEYGIDDLGGLAAVKFAVAGVVRPDGLLVLNADDPILRSAAGDLARRFGRSPPLGWFSHTESWALEALRTAGASTSGPVDGRLQLCHGGVTHDLGAIADMPLSVNGAAAYNVANLAGAALAAAALGIAPATIAVVLSRFGAGVDDNPGRLMRFDVNGVRVIVDYAHNPDGLRGLLEVAASLRSAGRLGVLLGQAGNRSDADMEYLAQVAARFAPDLVVVKENETQLRGRAPGETPRILEAALQRAGLPSSALAVEQTELAAARRALTWARPTDVLVFPIHSSSARAAVLELLRKG